MPTYQITRNYNPSEVVVDAIEDQLDFDPTTGEPLQRTVDVDSLNALVESNPDIQIQFGYRDLDITVTAEAVTIE